MASGAASTSVATAAADVLNAGEEAAFVEEAVIDGDIEAAAGLGIEEAVEAGGFHGQERVIDYDHM
jgi:hypothetical protein